jgi:hypothetical protein
MLAKHLALAAVSTVLFAAPALAQQTRQPMQPPNTDVTAPPSTGTWMREVKPDQWRASKLSGLNVYNNANEKIGEGTLRRTIVRLGSVA